jgi:hypothetical protein
MHRAEKRFVYILRSDKNQDRHYVGLTSDHISPLLAEAHLMVPGGNPGTEPRTRLTTISAIHNH